MYLSGVCCALILLEIWQQKRPSIWALDMLTRTYNLTLSLVVPPPYCDIVYKMHVISTVFTLLLKILNKRRLQRIELNQNKSNIIQQPAL
jgi:hypothetical protein